MPAGGRTASMACEGSVMMKGPYSEPRHPAVWKALSSSDSPPENPWPMSMKEGMAGFLGPLNLAIHAPMCGAATVSGGS